MSSSPTRLREPTYNSRQQTALSYSQDSSHSHEPSVILDESETHGHDTPHDCQGREPYFRRYSPQNEITGDLTRDIGRVIHRQPRIILMISHFQTGFQAVCLRIPDIRTIEEGAEEKECEDG
jgi:hypothetical protein